VPATFNYNTLLEQEMTMPIYQHSRS